MKPNSRSAEEAIKQNAVQKKKPKSSTSKEQKSGKTLKQGEEQKKVKQNSIISKQNKLLKEKTNSQSSVYVDLFAAAVLVFGGALACYGLLLCRKMRNVRSERSSSEIRKVVGLAIVSVLCFTSSAFAALFTDIPVLYHWHELHIDGVYTSILLILYYFIGRGC